MNRINVKNRADVGLNLNCIGFVQLAQIFVQCCLAFAYTRRIVVVV